MSRDYAAAGRSYTPDELIKGLRDLAETGIVNARRDTGLLLAAAKYIDAMTRTVDKFLTDQLRNSRTTPSEARAVIDLLPIPEDDRKNTGLLDE